MKNLFKEIKKDLLSSKKIRRGIKNISYLTVGSIVSKIINFIAFIFIVRFLSGESYGMYVTAGAFISMFSIVTLSGLNTVLAREGSKDISKMGDLIEQVAGLRILLGLLAMFIITIVVWFMNYSLELKLLVIVFSASIYIRAIKGNFDPIFIATEKLKCQTYSDIGMNVFFAVFSISLLYLDFGVLTLIFVQIFSWITSLMISYHYGKKLISFKLFSKIKLNYNLIKPALVFSLLAFTGYLINEVDLVMISLFFPPEVVGKYGVAYKIARTGITLRGIIAIAFLPIFVKTLNKRAISKKKFINYSVLFGVIIFLISFVLSIYSKDIIYILLGDGFELSARILSVLIFWLALVYFSIPMGVAAKAANFEKILLKVNVSVAALNIFLNYVLILKIGIIGVAYSTLICYSIKIAITFVFVYSGLIKKGLLK